METKKVWQYDQITNKLVGEVILNETDKGAVGEWLLHGGCVEVTPPAQKENFDIYWMGTAWEYREIEKEPEPEKPPEPTFEELKQQKLMQISAWTKQAITSGFESNVKNEVRVYDSTDEDQATLNAMYNASRSPDFASHPVYNGQIPIRSYLKDKTSADKIIAGYNAVEMQKLVDDQALHIGACKQKGWTLQELVKNTNNKEELEKIEWA